MKPKHRQRFDSSATIPRAYVSTPRALPSTDYSSAPSPYRGGAERRSSRGRAARPRKTARPTVTRGTSP